MTPVLNSTTEHRPDGALKHGVLTYARALAGVGGQQVEAQWRLGDDAMACAALYWAPPCEVHVPGLAVSRLCLHLTQGRVSGGVDGEWPRSFHARRYSLFITPAHAAARWLTQAPSRHMNIYYCPGVFTCDDELAADVMQPRAWHNVVVPGLRRVADPLLDELQRTDKHSTDAADSLIRLLLIRVFRHLRGLRPGAPLPGEGVAARLQAYVLAHLHERILVADLAAQARIPIDRFVVAFKEETGRTPYQFVLALRLQQASDLLRTSTLPVADVAQACGFSSQQHLTHTMRRHEGVTPARLRESLREGVTG